MKVSGSPTPPPTAPANKPEAPKPPEKPPSSEKPDNYNGPADGTCSYDPKVAKWLKPLVPGVVAAMVREHASGLENVQESGSHMMVCNHQSYADAPIVLTLAKRDYRSLAAIDQFTGVLGKALTAMGAIPVDRKAHSTKPIEEVISELNKGNGVIVFPEGKFNAEVGEFKEGTAMMAMRSKAETVVPSAISYQKHEVGVGARLATYGAAAAVAVGGILAAVAGGPAVRATAGALTGVLGGALVGGAVGFATTKGDIKEKGLSAARDAGIGATLAGLAGGFGHTLLGNQAVYLAAPLSVAGGLTTLAIGKYMSGRDDAFVAVGKPIPIQPYRDMPNQKEARAKLTADMRQAVVDLKAGLEKKPA